MKILLLGEYSNVHATLAEGLRTLGHTVVVASNGDFWKDYPRDIDLSRRRGPFGGIELWFKVIKNLPKFRGFDIVQIINPVFFELKAERLFSIFNYLARNNKKVVMCAFGMDYYWIKRSDEGIFRYGDFNIGIEPRGGQEVLEARWDWIDTQKEELNKLCANSSDAIVTGLYEYDLCYRPLFQQKTHFIPFPIKMDENVHIKPFDGKKLKIFVGVSKGRSSYKGTDVMLRAAQEVQKEFPDRMEIIIAEGLPFKKYRERMFEADVILDQLYSYTPAMNALEAMSHGIICVGGGEPENYEILGEKELRPIINVEPKFEHCVEQIRKLVTSKDSVINTLKHQSVEYVRRHHEFQKVASQYQALYRSLTIGG